jgi:hypothetical protein
MIELSKARESPVKRRAIPPSAADWLPTIEQFTKRVAPVGRYNPLRPRDLFPEITQFTKVDPVDPVLKYANPPLDEPLELASLPRIRMFEKEHDTLP